MHGAPSPSDARGSFINASTFVILLKVLQMQFIDTMKTTGACSTAATRLESVLVLSLYAMSGHGLMTDEIGGKNFRHPCMTLNRRNRERGAELMTEMRMWRLDRATKGRRRRRRWLLQEYSDKLFKLSRDGLYKYVVMVTAISRRKLIVIVWIVS